MRVSGEGESTGIGEFYSGELARCEHGVLAAAEAAGPCMTACLATGPVAPICTVACTGAGGVLGHKMADAAIDSTQAI